MRISQTILMHAVQAFREPIRSVHRRTFDDSGHEPNRGENYTTLSSMQNYTTLYGMSTVASGERYILPLYFANRDVFMSRVAILLISRSPPY